MMRIGFDGTPLRGQRSGVGHYTGRLLVNLVAEFPEWEYLLFSNQPLDSLEQALSVAIPVTDHFTLGRWLWMQCFLPGTIRRHQPDLCHFPNNSAPLCVPAPYVITIHDASLFLHRQYHPLKRLLALRLLMPFVARRATAVITVSEHARRELIRVLHLPPQKVFTIPEAAAAEFQPVTNPMERERLRRKYDLPEIFILYVGTIEPRKNLTRLIRAVGRLHRQGCQAHLVLAGPVGWVTMGSLYKEMEVWGLKGAIQYLGYVPQADLPGIYSLATAFAFPSLYEGFGLPPLEAMACGVPVLTSQHSAMAEICGNAAYLVDPYDEEMITGGLANLLTNAGYRKELRQRGLARAKQYSWRKTARETAFVFEQVLNGASGT